MKELRELFPDLHSDPNDCYFEDLTIENERHKHLEKKFFHIVDMRLNLNINNDNRFSYYAPTVTNVSPHVGVSNGGQKIEIMGANFGVAPIIQVLVKNVPCQSFTLINPHLLSCITGENFSSPSAGNVIIKMSGGLTSPIRTCKMFEYTPRRLIIPAAVIIKPNIITPLITQQVIVKKDLFPEDLGKRKPKKLLGEPDC